jgi:ankyrin repeat protein
LRHACTHRDNRAVVSALLTAGAKADWRDKTSSLLAESVRSNDLESIKLLIAARADANGSGCVITPLHAALTENLTAAAQLLVDAKADVNGTDMFGKVGLHAICSGNVAMVDLMVKAGFDALCHPLDHGTGNGTRNSCLHVAAQDGKLALSRVQFHGADTDHVESIAENLISRPSDPEGVLRYLIDLKAPLEARDYDGKTPLMVAAQYRNLGAMRVLLDAGADPKAVDYHDCSLMFYAVDSRSVAVAKVLAAAGASVDAVSPKGNSSCLLVAISNEDVAMVKGLIALGADVNLAVNAIAPHDMARHVGSQEMMTALEAAGACPWMVRMAEQHYIVGAAMTGNASLVAFLLMASDAEAQQIALTIAVAARHRDIALLLLAAETDPSCSFGFLTPLHNACQQGDVELVRAFLDAGADMGLKCPISGLTAMQTAARGRQREVVAALVAKANELKNKTK